MCYVFAEGTNWTADTNYICDDDEGELLKTELHETLGKKIQDIVAELRKHPKIVQAVNNGFTQELQITVDLSPPAKNEEPDSLDW